MSPQEFQKLLQAHRRELDALLRARLPVIVGAMAKSHFQAGFRQGGFIDRGLQPWQPAKRQSGSGTAARYGPLLSSRRHLYSSIAYAPAAYRVVITNPVPYAAIHNDGGTVSPTVTDRMRRYAWARYYQAAGAAAAPGHSRGKRGQAAVQRLSQLMYYSGTRWIVNESKG